MIDEHAIKAEEAGPRLKLAAEAPSTITSITIAALKVDLRPGHHHAHGRECHSHRRGTNYKYVYFLWDMRKYAYSVFTNGKRLLN